MALNRELLRYYIAKHNDTAKQLAEKIGVSTASMTAKMQERGTRCFDIREVQKIRKLYQLTDSEVIEIFFADDVAADSGHVVLRNEGGTADHEDGRNISAASLES